MIGNATFASYALDGDLPYLSEGTARRVYLQDGIVYKVDIEPDSNNAEMGNYIRLRDMDNIPDFIVIPEITEYEIGDEIVLAMPYITGEFVGECFCPDYCQCPPGTVLSDDIIDAINNIGITDLNSDNVISAHGKYYLIDLEC